MAARRTPIFVTILIAVAVLYTTWTTAHGFYQHIIIGTVDVSVVFEHRVHTFVIDDSGFCKIPAWVADGSGTLVTTGDCLNEEWTVEKVGEGVDATAVAHDLCARGHKMNCLLVSHNKRGASYRSLKNLVRLSLAKYANEDVAWNCGPGCELIPAQFSYCMAYQRFGPSSVPDDFSEATAKCKLLQHKTLSL